MEVLYVSSSHHLIRRQGEWNALQQPPEELPSTTSSSTHLPLPNPFRGLASRSAEQVQEDVSDDKACAAERLSFSEDDDMGAVALGGPVIGLRTTPYANGVRGIVWTADELAVSFSAPW